MPPRSLLRLPANANVSPHLDDSVAMVFLMTDTSLFSFRIWHLSYYAFPFKT